MRIAPALRGTRASQSTHLLQPSECSFGFCCDKAIRSACFKLDYCCGTYLDWRIETICAADSFALLILLKLDAVSKKFRPEVQLFMATNLTMLGPFYSSFVPPEDLNSLHVLSAGSDNARRIPIMNKTWSATDGRTQQSIPSDIQ